MAATSILHQRANDIRQQRVNWQSYLQSQMITQEDYQFISSFESSNGEQRNQFLQQNRNQCSKTFLSLLSHISKDQTIQYVLCMLDDLILEDKSRVEIFKEYSKKKKESVWDPFLNLLNRNDGFIQNMVRLLFSVKTFLND